jgi:MFS family permease
LIGVGSLMAPRLSTVLGGKIRAVVATQSSSIVFLLLLGFSPGLWLASVSYLVRTALMNMSAPLYSAYCMERTPEEHQGLVNSVLNLAWSVGWAVGPFISGLVQQHYGFAPLFIATAVLYAVACLLVWLLFRRSETGGAVSQVVLRSPEYPE